jgi:N6-L-threonylcarbamoyladenine synthase
MLTLGIETSCDETAVALYDGKVLAEEVASSAARNAPFGGVVPEIASRSHLEGLLPCLDGALKKAGVRLGRVRLVAVTQGPGLMGSLVVGVAAAKALGVALGVPVVPVDHVLAHALAAQIGRGRFRFPFLGLVVSGGHTLLVHWRRLEDLAIIGRTFDDAAGEAFDKVAKILDLGYPGGPVVDRLARSADPSKIPFPRPWLNEKHHHFSFSGLKTAVLYTVEDMRRRGPVTDRDKAEICAGFQEAVCDVLVAKTLRAARERGVRRIVVGGGVAANSRLRERFAEAGAGFEVLFPFLKLAADNAVMIAALGRELYRSRARRGARAAAKRGRLDFAPYSDFFAQKKGLVV